MNDRYERSNARTALTEARNTRKQQTIFYVDDNPRALRMLTSVLRGCGYKVVAAGTTSEALASMEQFPLDLTLLAYRLLRMIGFKLAHDIKLRSPGTPVVLISGHTLREPEELTHVDAYVGRGATLDSLLTNIRVLIRRGEKHSVFPHHRIGRIGKDAGPGSADYLLSSVLPSRTHVA
ncbi:MAG TPA: response regulator [Candidatus Acidoferrum sp.]|nr:response regulator [Candidatus Acidoferrum sp.]